MISCKVVFNFLLLFGIIEARSLKKTGDPWELNDFFTGTFSARSLNASWLNEDSLLHRDPSGNVVQFNVKTRNSTIYLDRSVLSGYTGASPIISPDRLFFLIRYNVSAVFRHSTTALYAIYDIENDAYYDIENKNQTQYAQWAPQGHGLVYVFENNIYYLEHPSSEPRALTVDGVPGVIYNGVPDWVYEEEVLGSGSALWFSPDAKQLAFASFDDTDVEEFMYFIYGTPGSSESQYPQEVKIKYPKVGRKNPVVRVYVVNLETGVEQIVPTEVKVIPEKWSQDEDYILYDIVWVTNDEFAVLYTNRVQNHAELTRCTKNAECVATPEATYSEANGWLEPHIPRYSKNGTKKIEILAQPQGDDKFDHLVLTDLETKIEKRLTEGLFYVLSVIAWDEDNNLIYFVRSGDNKHSERQVYVLDLESDESKCLTCSMVTSQGSCKYATASLSRDYSYIAKVCQGPGPFVTEIQNLSDESDVFVWEDNQALNDRLASKALPVIKDLQVPVDDGFYANVRLFLPPNLDETASKKYPAVVYVYAGPNTNLITDAYSSGFQNYIVTNREYIYIYIDARGSGKDGQNKTFQIYRKLATAEIQDQITVTKFLQNNLTYIDANNTGIWGWSYGGFAAAWALVQDTENVFKFALSVAPVTSFIYYDSIYTERYMGLPDPDDNLEGYNNTDLTRKVEALRGKLFFLIHGNADDNVHYQQSMLLSKALEQADILFRQQSYPDENHSLGGVSRHLYHTIDRFWARSFNLPDPPLIK